MELTVRTLEKSDYQDILVGWWNDWGWTPPAIDFLPQEGTGGLMVMDGEEPVCAGFMYATNSAVAWVDWIISSKTYRGRVKRKEAIQLLILTLTEIAKESGFKYVYALLKNRSLIEAYMEIGYVKGDESATEMIKAL